MTRHVNQSRTTQLHKTDYKYHTRGKHDQLNMIFNLLGTPNDADIEGLEREDARRYLKCFAKREGSGIGDKFPHVEDASIEMLQRMLRFNPNERVSVVQALEMHVIAEIRDPPRETVAPRLVLLEFEKEPDLDEGLLRKYFCREIRKYHPEVVEL